MVANKHIDKIILAVMAIAVVLCLLAVAFSGTLTAWLGGTGVTMEYESRLFDADEPMTVDIRMDEAEWGKMLSNAASEAYYVCDVTINGKTVKNVAIRPKGNTSLSAIAMDPDSDRYSFKLEFDHFVEGQTCYGLDSSTSSPGTTTCPSGACPWAAPPPPTWSTMPSTRPSPAPISSTLS